MSKFLDGVLVLFSCFPVDYITPDEALQDLGAFLDVSEICTGFGLQGYECEGLDGLHKLPDDIKVFFKFNLRELNVMLTPLRAG